MCLRRCAFPYGLALALAAWLWSVPARCAEVDKLLPEDTDLVVSINVRQVVDSDVFRKVALDQVKEWMKTDPRGQAMTVVGLDPLRDINRIILTGPAGQAIEKEWLAIVHGAFNLDKVQAAVKLLVQFDAKRVTIHKQGNVFVYELRNPQRPEPLFVAFLNENTLVVSPIKDQVMDAVARGESKKEAILPRDLQALVSTMDDRQSLWLAGTPVEFVNHDLAKNPRLRALAANIRSFSGTIQVTDAARVDLRIATSNLRSARQIRTIVEGARAVTILALTSNETSTDSTPPLVGILGSVQVGEDKNDVVIRGLISGELIGNWINEKLNKESKPAPAAGTSPRVEPAAPVP